MKEIVNIYENTSCERKKKSVKFNNEPLKMFEKKTMFLFVCLNAATLIDIIIVVNSWFCISPTLRHDQIFIYRKI
jgi:hypothetical protein